LIYLFALPALAFLPRATIGSVLFVAGLNLIEVFEIGFIMRMGSVRDIAYLLVSFAATAFTTTEIGLMVSILLSLMTLLKKSSKPEMTIMGQVEEVQYNEDPQIPPSTQTVYRSIEDSPMAILDEDILVIKILNSIRFYNSNLLRDRISQLEKRSRLLSAKSAYGDVHPHEFVIDVGLCKEIDSTGALVIYELLHTLHAREVHVTFANVNDYHRKVFEKSGISEEVGADRLCGTLAEATARAKGHQSEKEKVADPMSYAAQY